MYLGDFVENGRKPLKLQHSHSHFLSANAKPASSSWNLSKASFPICYSPPTLWQKQFCICVNTPTNNQFGWINKRIAAKTYDHHSICIFERTSWGLHYCKKYSTKYVSYANVNTNLWQMRIPVKWKKKIKKTSLPHTIDTIYLHMSEIMHNKYLGQSVFYALNDTWSSDITENSMNTPE